MGMIIIVHVSNEEPFMAEIEALPEPTSQVIIVTNPRRPDGRELHYMSDDATEMILPWHRINFIEVVHSEGREEVESFVRE